MSYIRLANLFDLYTVGDTGRESVLKRYNNATPLEVVSYNGANYTYLSFIYQGASKNRTGDNLEAQLIFSANQISTGFAREAVTKRQLVRVYSALMTKDNKVEKILTTEDWVAASLSYDCETLEVILSSSIDAVGANAPTRVLTREIVGNLPVTGNINAV